jgi:polysaccharide biosynthesis/export protein
MKMSYAAHSCLSRRILTIALFSLGLSLLVPHAYALQLLPAGSNSDASGSNSPLPGSPDEEMPQNSSQSSADIPGVNPFATGVNDTVRATASTELDSTQESSTLSANGSSASLSADQILSILQQNPDALIELKSLMADMSQQQGTPVQEDQISDQMLYSGISTSPELRANITTFLRARGYITSSGSPDRGDVDYAWSPFSTNPPSPFSAPRAQPLTRFDKSATNIATRPKASSPVPSLDDIPGQPKVLREPAPYNLAALRDLYTQLPQQSGSLQRFGSNLFLHRDADTANLLDSKASTTGPDVPAGSEYVIGPGDALSISLWGGVSQNLTRAVDRDGRLALPEAGPVQVAGFTLDRAQGVIAQALQRQYRNVQVAVTLARLRSIRIYVVGDVQRPGAYEVGSLATPISALYAAGGPTNVGSLRLLRHYRGKYLVGEIDLYDFLLHGVQQEDRLQSGDTLTVPPAGAQVAIYGAVRRPAIYEMKGRSSLASLLDDAGGLTVSAELSHIVIERIDAKHERETIDLGLQPGSTAEVAEAAEKTFTARDGDRIHVSAILPYSQRVIYLEGHVVRPGRTPYRDGMQLSDLLHSYQDLLPEPADRGEVIRLVPPDLHPQTIEFNLPDVLVGNTNLSIQPFDTIRVFGRYQADAPRVTIRGEVLRPGTYPLSLGMTATELVGAAGGFKRGALLTTADLTSYTVVNGTEVEISREDLRIGDAVLHHDPRADTALKPGDVLTIHQLAGWNDIGSSITLEGEVEHPGSYGFQQGERLSSILRRAGGFRATAYPAGAVLIREDVRKLEEKSREQLIRQIETSSASARLSPAFGAGDQAAVVQLVAQQQQDILARLRNEPPSGRMVIHISADIASWENSAADIEVRNGDVLRIPKRPGFVLVSGQVYNESAITYSPGKTADWYLHRAGGTTEVANRKEIFIIRANGSVVGREPGLWGREVLSARLDPGDVVVVPQKIIGTSLFWRNLLTIAQITSSISITAAVAGVL